jgi:hypothetical protein
LVGLGIQQVMAGAACLLMLFVMGGYLLAIGRMVRRPWLKAAVLAVLAISGEVLTFLFARDEESRRWVAQTILMAWALALIPLRHGALVRHVLEGSLFTRRLPWR